MTDKSTDKAFQLDYGLEDITFNEVISPHLPQKRATLLPGKENYTEKLDQLWNTSSLENFLLEALVPKISDERMIMPQQYRDMQKKMLKKFKVIEKEKNSVIPDHIKQRAISILEQDKALMDLLTMYYHTLHRA